MITDKEYFSLTQYVSNSMLGELERMISGVEFNFDTKKVFSFGSLVDALLTEPEKINHFRKSIGEGTDELFFTDEEWNRALDMRRDAMTHPIFQNVISCFSKQEVKIEEQFLISHEGFFFTLPARCKYDFVSYPMKMGADLKSTACTSLQSFKQSISSLSYDRQAAWYMDLGGLDMFYFLGVSKQKNKKGHHDVFVYAVKKGDELYESGKRKYEALAFKYFLTIYDTQKENSTINSQ